jgi:cation transport protein ChaC
MGEFWVFGYGSLMWRPGFVHEEHQLAHVHGYRRALCVRSFVHRGTEASPGLVLGLDRGGSCLGVAFRVSDTLREEVLAYLRERELVTNVYRERILPVRLSDGRRVEAVGYVVDRAHVQYAGALETGAAADVVAGAAGQAGPNTDYVINTVAHLTQLGIRDAWLERVAAAVTKREG